MFALTGTDFRSIQAITAPRTMSGIHVKAAFWYQTSRAACPGICICWLAPRKPSIPKPMSHGVSSWTSETPKLPIPAWMPRAVPCLAAGRSTRCSA